MSKRHMRCAALFAVVALSALIAATLYAACVLPGMRGALP